MAITPPRKKVLAVVLAGGEGKRLMPLTADRAKPAVALELMLQVDDQPTEPLLGIYPAAMWNFDGTATIEVLEPLQPRLYSISSSPRTNPGRVSLTVDAVRFECLDDGVSGARRVARHGGLLAMQR